MEKDKHNKNNIIIWLHQYGTYNRKKITFKIIIEKKEEKKLVVFCNEGWFPTKGHVYYSMSQNNRASPLIFWTAWNFLLSFRDISLKFGTKTFIYYSTFISYVRRDFQTSSYSGSQNLHFRCLFRKWPFPGKRFGSKVEFLGIKLN